MKQFTNLDRGIPQLREALARHAPGSAEPYFELAKAYTEIGQMQEAKQFYPQALARDAGYRPAVSGLAKAFARSGEFAKAADLLESVVHKGGGDATVLNDLGLGTALAQRGRASEAAEHLQAAATSADSSIGDQARDLLRQMGSLRR